jgi:hypothetical protein
MRSQQEDGFQILTPSRGRHIRYPPSLPRSTFYVPRADAYGRVRPRAIEVSAMSSTFFSSMRTDDASHEDARA